MTDEAKVEKKVAKEKVEVTGKDAIYEKIAQAVMERTTTKIGKTGGHAIFDLVVSEVFQAGVKDGTFRFNGGHGSLHLRKYQAGARRLPSGKSTTFGVRSKLRYEEGVTVRQMVEGGVKAPKAAKPAKVAEPVAKAAEVDLT